MVSEITPDLFEGIFGKSLDEIESKPEERSKQVQYWRKCNGVYRGRACPIHTQELSWITLGPVMAKLTAQEYYDFQRSKHAEPLVKYGAYVLGKISAGSENSKYDVAEADRRFEPLIEQNGLMEIPIDQMIAYNWHHIPVVVKYVPQLAQVVDVTCPHCTGRTFTEQEHLQTHISAKHEAMQQSTAISSAVANAVSSGGMTPEGIAAIVMAVREAMKTEKVS